MKKIDGNSSAYPTRTEGGMTIRAQMAAMICAGMCADPNLRGTFEEVAKVATTQADALIAELNKTEETNK